MVTVEAVGEGTPEVLAAVGAHLPQLSPDATPPTAEQLTEIVTAEAITPLVARDDGGPILGMLTLVVFRIPSELRARIEDVVVDDAARGRGIGEALTREALRRAIAVGARTVELTTSPRREAANRLYQRIGFVRRETNAYHYRVPSGPGAPIDA